MAKDRKFLQHIHSSVADKQPTPSTLEIGELAINNAEGKEFISLKNSNNKVVRLSSDEQIVTWMEKKAVMPYSGVVDNIHLDTNRSNIELKFNQVAASNTKFYEKVNGAVDIDGNPVNPSTDGGVTNGAGISIDTSMFALNGGNPVFSSLTVNNNAIINNILYPLNGLSETLSWDYSDVKNATSGSTNFKNSVSFSIPNDVKHINRRTLNIDYLNCDESFMSSTLSGITDSIYDPGAASGDTLHIPRHTANLTRAKLEYKYGSLYNNAFSNGIYDPGEKCDNSVSDTLVIPTTIEDLLNSSGNCISITKDVCVNGKVSASEGMYTSSDESLKENINYIGDIDTYKSIKVPFKTFNFKSDEAKRKMYGVIAQDVEKAGLNELVHYDEKGIRSVDYTGLLILRIAQLEMNMAELKLEIEKLKKQ